MSESRTPSNPNRRSNVRATAIALGLATTALLAACSSTEAGSAARGAEVTSSSSSPTPTTAPETVTKTSKVTVTAAPSSEKPTSSRQTTAPSTSATSSTPRSTEAPRTVTTQETPADALEAYKHSPDRIARYTELFAASQNALAAIQASPNAVYTQYDENGQKVERSDAAGWVVAAPQAIEVGKSYYEIRTRQLEGGIVSDDIRELAISPEGKLETMDRLTFSNRAGYNGVIDEGSSLTQNTYALGSTGNESQYSSPTGLPEVKALDDKFLEQFAADTVAVELR